MSMPMSMSMSMSHLKPEKNFFLLFFILFLFLGHVQTVCRKILRCDITILSFDKKKRILFCNIFLFTTSHSHSHTHTHTHTQKQITNNK